MPSNRPRRPLTPASSNTSRSAASSGFSCFSMVPPGIIQQFLCLLLDMSSTWLSDSLRTHTHAARFLKPSWSHSSGTRFVCFSFDIYYFWLAIFCCCCCWRILSKKNVNDNILSPKFECSLLVYAIVLYHNLSSMIGIVIKNKNLNEKKKNHANFESLKKISRKKKKIDAQLSNMYTP